jgi:protein-disulfide isomerase
LPQHRFAKLAATAAECAGEQNRFAAMHDLLFQKQDSFGIKPWSNFATESGVIDSARFAQCFSNNPIQPKIAAGLALGDSIKLTATPTVIINGWRMYHGADSAHFASLIKNIKDRGKP